MLNGILTVFRKELLDTLRDRKTLIFMLLIPTVATPLIMLTVINLTKSVAQKQAAQVVKVVADADSHARYRAEVHRWFLETKMGTATKIATSPIVKALVKDEARQALDQIPPDIVKSPEAFEKWTHDLADQMREGIDSIEERTEGPVSKLPEELQDEALDFYQVAIKGLGLIEFVDPSTLGAPKETFDINSVPEELRGVPDIGKIAAAVRAKEIHGFLSVPPELDTLRGQDVAAVSVTFIHDSTLSLSGEANCRFTQVAGKAGKKIVLHRLGKLGYGENFLEPLKLKEDRDLASKSQQVLNAVGGFLPYLVIIFAFLGGIYPAIDLGAGEKERNTLETLLLSPSSRTELALGKYFVILATSLTAALLGVVSMAISVQKLVPAAVLDEIDLHIEPGMAIIIGLLAIPPAAIFAGLFLAISVYARTFKEAQNYMAPLQFVLIFPAVAPLIPGLEMSWKMAAIPLVNISLLAKDFLKGDINWGYYAVTLASCVALAIACIAYAVRQFSREEVLFRS
ncbi:ABC transporter permease [Candidatus Poribacteria bacterium]|nr:ABC transporter permease [Candidatus Poribacteria bacterium]